MNALDPKLVDHAMRLAEEEWDSARPAVQPAVIVPAGARAWFVVQTSSRGEAKAVDHLGAAGFETFVPVMRKDVEHRRKRGTWVAREFPLFNRYVFSELPCNSREWGSLLVGSDAVERVLGMGGLGLPVPEATVRRFMTAQAAGDFDETQAARIKRGEVVDPAQPVQLRFPIGARVRALRGPFGGFSGHVVGHGRQVVKAMIEIFGRLTPVEFDSNVVALD